MKHAHSIVLRHLVEAGNVPHPSMMDRRSLVQCPACSEPVLAIHRSEQHFFAHQPGTNRNQVADCELRVVRLAHEARSVDANRTARQDNLRFFMAIIDKMSLQAISGFVPLGSATLSQAIKATVLPGMLGVYAETLRATAAAKGAAAIMHDEDLKRFDEFTRHEFDMPMLTAQHQRGYAEDMLEMLVTPPCAPQLMRLLVAAFMTTFVFLGRSEEPDPGKELHGSHDAMGALLTYPDRAFGPRGLLTTATRPLYDGMNLSVAMAKQILLAIDYGGWLERRSTDSMLRLQAKAAMTVTPARHKRKPKPKKTHRKSNPGRARRTS